MKLVLSDAILTIGFLLSLGVFFLLSVTVARQKDLQIQAERTLNSLDSLEAETQNFLTTQDDLSQYRTPWFLSITDFKNNLETLAEMGSRSRLAPAEVEMLQSMLTAWLQIYEWYYLPAWRQLGILIAQDVSTLTEESGGLFIHYLARIDGETSTFISEFLSLAFNLQKHIDESIQRSRRWGIIFVLLTLIITFSITTRFSYLLVRRIHKVEEAVRQIANGDFSSKLDIQSGDEFEELSRNYNTLQEQLQTKLNSVLNFMVAITTGLEEGQNLDRLLSIIASSAMENTNASGAAIYFVNSEERTITPQAVTGYYPPPYPLSPDAFSSEEEAMTHARDNPIPIGTYTIGNAVKDSKPIFIRSASALNAKDFDFIRSQEDPLCIESLILAPLMVAHRVIGAIVIIKRPSSGTFTDLDFTHMQTFADYAALTIDNFYNTEELIEKREMHREITIAADIQKRLLPKAIPSLTSAQLFAFSRAARGVSGDYYDAFLIEEGKIGLLICDVVGKGVPASLMMTMIRTSIRLVPNPKRTPGKLLTFLNRGVIGEVGTEQFATVSMLTYDENSRTVTYANAAHPPLLLYRSETQSLLDIDAPGLPIGVEQREMYKEKSFRVTAGDVLILFTDGIPETRALDGGEYTTEGLRNRIQQCAQKSAKEIVKSIQGDLDSFAAGVEQYDDQTMIVLKVKE